MRTATARRLCSWQSSCVMPDPAGDRPLFADESLFDTDRGGPATDNLPDTPDYGGELSALVYDHGMSTARMSPAVFAAHELALTMRGIGMRVGAASRTQPPRPPPSNSHTSSRRRSRCWCD